MDEQTHKEIVGKKQRDQMLKLVAKSFYNELTNYGVSEHEIINVASAMPYDGRNAFGSNFSM